MTEPTDAELDAVLCSQWPAFSMQATLVRMWVRAAMRDAIAKWGTPAPVEVEPVAYVEVSQTDSEVSMTWGPEPAGFDLPRGRHALFTSPQPTQSRAGAVPLADEQIKTLMQAHHTAMLMTCKARVPECGVFAAIAQDLDWLCESLAIKGGRHGADTRSN